MQNDTGYMRSHCDINAISELKLLTPNLKAKEKFRGLMVEVQIVAFPLLCLVADPKSVDLVRAAMRQGADIVGGMPHAEAAREESAKHIEITFQIAQKFDADIDMHLDETDDHNSCTLGTAGRGDDPLGLSGAGDGLSQLR